MTSHNKILKAMDNAASESSDPDVYIPSENNEIYQKVVLGVRKKVKTNANKK